MPVFAVVVVEGPFGMHESDHSGPSWYTSRTAIYQLNQSTTVGCNAAPRRIPGITFAAALLPAFAQVLPGRALDQHPATIAGPHTTDGTTSLTVANVIHQHQQAGPFAASCLSGVLWQPPSSVSTVARPYQEFSFDFEGGHPQESDPNNAAVAQVTSAGYQQLLPQAYHQQPVTAYLSQHSQPAQEYTQYGISSVLPSQMSAPEPTYSMDQTQLLATQKPRQMSHVTSVSSHYGSPYQSPGTVAYQAHQSASQSRKRSFQEDTTSYTYDYPGLQQLQSHAAGSQVPVELTPHGHHAQLQPGAALQYQPYPSQRPSPQHSHSGQSSSIHSQSLQYQQQAQQQQHHHHRLPNQQPPNKMQRTMGSFDATLSPPDEDDHGPPSVVGQPGMPAPAPRPKGPKLKFTPEDDALLVELKETKNLTWKQIADFFPGRSSGTLQVRYCTKLKAKTTVWTDEMLHRLRTAIQEYETDRWRIISSKVGNGFSATACKDKALELVEEDEALLLQQQQRQQGVELESPASLTATLRRESVGVVGVVGGKEGKF
ncbi:hypothetical protein M409DRAFT_21385 [Zasmidium cellare ATCC 36951]|uniref:Myb-like domain-containing protein n=1 Tax=Zasmidium cellare ATCC 36951 TaxID=1080233 RepID=A0A6A6CNL9_ZASCE|nr:uncharacterized protein M409DRAFT_21385 [Zasmidium cellare ATCC 36951]KAF2168641.1 hypothetical protein M409DRAFT_21385 [Zasmidium cellare ATCC 36951]